MTALVPAVPRVLLPVHALLRMNTADSINKAVETVKHGVDKGVLAGGDVIKINAGRYDDRHRKEHRQGKLKHVCFLLPALKFFWVNQRINQITAHTTCNESQHQHPLFPLLIVCVICVNLFPAPATKTKPALKVANQQPTQQIHHPVISFSAITRLIIVRLENKVYAILAQCKYFIKAGSAARKTSRGAAGFAVSFCQ
jgi:hypothetical protein